MTPTNTIVDPATKKEYEEVLVFLSSAPIPNKKSYPTAVNISFVPAHWNEEKQEWEQWPDGGKKFVYPDILRGDAKALEAFAIIHEAVRKFAQSKSL